MKRVIIKSGFVGLLIRLGKLTKVLSEGSHWVRSSDEIYTYDLSKPFHPAMELNVLLKNEQLAQMLALVEVKDNEIALQYVNGNFKYVLKPGRYAFWKGITEYKSVIADVSDIKISEHVDKSLYQTPELAPFIRTVSVEPYEKALLYIDEKFAEILGSGEYFFWKNQTKIKVAKADMRNQQLEVSGQEILSRDKASLRINFFAQYKVVDIAKALSENNDYTKQLYVLMQLALREYIGTRDLDELLENKESIGGFVLSKLQASATDLGIAIKDCGVKDIILPGDVKEIMNQVLVAQKKAQANVITRREETASTRSLLNTAKLLEENEMLFKLKEMEYVEKIADKINTISLSGGNQIVDQLKQIFVSGK
ncbi:MAG: slipin family protein [Salinivirgaceae bacterium]